jgi:DNA-binding MarR family transcriptional regulator
MSDRQWMILNQLGGAEWLRALLDKKAPMPKKYYEVFNNREAKRAQAFLESNPAASVNEVTFRFGMTKQSVYALRNKMKKEGFVFPKRSEQLVSLTPAGLALAEGQQMIADKLKLTTEEYLEAINNSQKQKQTGIEMYDDPWQPPEMPPMPEVDATLDARAVDYGKFIEGAEVMQMLKRIVLNALNNRDKVLAHDQAESLDMIIHKIGRIINGNPDVVDHWLDIAGYAQLVADRLNGRIR